MKRQLCNCVCQRLDIFLTMKVLENTPAVLSLGKLCDENGYSYEWIKMITYLDEVKKYWKRFSSLEGYFGFGVVSTGPVFSPWGTIFE